MTLGLGIKSILTSSVSSVVAQRVPNFKGITLLNKIICSLYVVLSEKKYYKQMVIGHHFPLNHYIYICVCLYFKIIYIYIYYAYLFIIVTMIMIIAVISIAIIKNIVMIIS